MCRDHPVCLAPQGREEGTIAAPGARRMASTHRAAPVSGGTALGHVPPKHLLRAAPVSWRRKCMDVPTRARSCNSTGPRPHARARVRRLPNSALCVVCDCVVLRSSSSRNASPLVRFVLKGGGRPRREEQRRRSSRSRGRGPRASMSCWCAQRRTTRSSAGAGTSMRSLLGSARC
jgi:hypothetical protein